MSEPSALETIQANVVAELKTVEGIGISPIDGQPAAKAASPSQMFKITTHPNSNEIARIDPVTLPDAYPGHVVSLNEDEIKLIDAESGSIGGHAVATYEVPIYVAGYVYTDGTDAEEARRLACRFGEATQRKLMVFCPITSDTAGMTAPWVLRAAEFGPIPVDSNTHGLLMKFWAKYQLQASLTT